MATQLETRTTNEFGLEPGKPVELMFDYPAKVRMKLKLIGYDPGRFIILKSPDSDEYQDVLVEGNMTAGRFVIEGEKGLYCAFKTSIRNITKFPDRFVILNYPSKIAQQHLRKHQRITVHLPTKLNFEQEDQHDILGVVADISSHGCALEIDRSDVKTDPKKKFIRMEVFHPQGQLLQINAYVCNVRLDQEKVHIGVSFVDAEAEIEDLLKHLLICTAM